MTLLASLSASILGLAVTATWLGCSSGIPNPSQKDASPAAIELSSRAIWASLEALTPQAKSQLYEQVSQMTFSAYYDLVAAHRTSTPIFLDGSQTAVQDPSLSFLHTTTLALGARFATFGAMWRALGIDPRDASLADLQASPSLIVGDGERAGLQLASVAPSPSEECQADHRYYRRVWNIEATATAAALNYKNESEVASVPVTSVITLKDDADGESGLWAYSAAGFIPNSPAYLERCFVNAPSPGGVLISNPGGDIAYGVPEAKPPVVD